VLQVNEALPRAYQCAESSSSSSDTDSDSHRPRRPRISSNSSNVPAAFRADRFESSSSSASERDSTISDETDADTLSSRRSSQRTHRSLPSPFGHHPKTPSPLHSTRSRTAASQSVKHCRKQRWTVMLNGQLKKNNGDIVMNKSAVLDDESERCFVFSLL
jgi:hypothetical protein